MVSSEDELQKVGSEKVILAVLLICCHPDPDKINYMDGWMDGWMDGFLSSWVTGPGNVALEMCALVHKHCTLHEWKRK